MPPDAKARSSTGLSPAPKGFKTLLFHVPRDEVPIVLLYHHGFCRRNDVSDLLGTGHDFSYRPRNLLRRILVHRPTGYRLIGITFLIEKEIRDAALLSRDNGQLRRHR